MKQEPTIYVIDDDPTVLKSLRWMIGSTYPRIQTYSSGAEFLDHYDGLTHGCAILDMRMPQMTGLDVQTHLTDRGVDLPVIIMTGHGDIPICTKSFHAGAFDFITKPASTQLLLERIEQAIAADELRYPARLDNAERAARLATLTAHERHVIDRVVDGKSLKQIASELDCSVQTATGHRARALEKLEVENDAELVRIALFWTAS